MRKPYLYTDVLSEAQVHTVRHWMLKASFYLTAPEDPCF